MSDIKAGDVVEIKSGGPRMVVVRREVAECEIDHVWVQWFEESIGDVRACKVAVTSLVKRDDQA